MPALARLVLPALLLALAGAAAPVAADDDAACEQEALRVELLQSGFGRTGAVLVSGRGGRADGGALAPSWEGWGTLEYVVPPEAAGPSLSATSAEVAAATTLRPTDVVVITYPKTGTTWLQQICEQLRSGGDMNFTEITERQPWLDAAWDCGQDLNADQTSEPRVFKSHQKLSAINTGAKYLSIIRDPGEVLVSLFAFQKSKGTLPFAMYSDVNEYAATGHFAMPGNTIWEYYIELWNAREDPSLLVLRYEALELEPKLYIARINDFLGLPRDVDRLQTAYEMSTKSFMLNHSSKFDDLYVEECWGTYGTTSKVTTTDKKDLNQDTKAWLRRLWRERMLLDTGMQTYEELAQVISELSSM